MRESRTVGKDELDFLRILRDEGIKKPKRRLEELKEEIAIVRKETRKEYMQKYMKDKREKEKDKCTQCYKHKDYCVCYNEKYM